MAFLLGLMLAGPVEVDGLLLVFGSERRKF
jgi:hypothetical protein